MSLLNMLECGLERVPVILCLISKLQKKTFLNKGLCLPSIFLKPHNYPGFLCLPNYNRYKSKRNSYCPFNYSISTPASPHKKSGSRYTFSIHGE